MKVALLFPGQGAEQPGMGLDLLPASPDGAALLSAAGAACGQDLAVLLRRGGPALLRTEVLQPALLAASLVALMALQRGGVVAAAVAGHSAGELAAWVAAGGLSAEEAIALSARRGAHMGRAAAQRPGGMVALRDAGPGECLRALRLGRRQGILDVAAHNGPRRFVLSGEVAALRAVSAALPSARLPVSGAWHSRLMAPAMAGFAQALQGVPARPLQVPVVSCRRGAVVDAAGLRGDVLLGLCRPVRFRAVLLELQRQGINHFVTVGPGKVLRGLLRDNLGPAAVVWTTEDARELMQTIAQLGGR